MATTMTKDFKKCLDAMKIGDRKIYQKLSTLILNLIQDEKPLQAPRPESRMEDALKWDLGDGHRCLGVKSGKDLLLLSCGKHDDVEQFINRHIGFYAPKSGTHVISLSKPEITEYAVSANAETSLSFVQKDFFLNFGMSVADAESFANRLKSISGADSPDFFEVLTQLPAPVANMLLEYVVSPNKREAIEGLANGTFEKVAGEKLIELVKKPENSEEFLTFTDPHDLEAALDKPLEDWMLYLHPLQRRWAYSSMSGPARLRGISGSGKTSVAIHRASYLARLCTGNETVLFTTFSPGLADVVSEALKKLCGLEINHIVVKTIGQLCMMILNRQAGKLDLVKSREAYSGAFMTAYNDIRKTIPRDLLWSRTTPEYLYEEIRYLKGKFLDEDVEQYLKIARHGRSLALTEVERKVILPLYKRYQQELGDKYDFEDLPREALRRLLESDKEERPHFKSVIIDEVQDFSEIELKLLFQLSGGNENQFFMAGDGAQKIYRAKTYSLSSLGIEIAGRATVLKKNYRNTRQILEAAYQLVKSEEFEDFGEDTKVAHVLPEFSVRTGPRPSIIKFADTDQECAWVQAEINRLIASGVPARGIAILSSGTSYYRTIFSAKLAEANIPATLYSEDQAFTEPGVKISTFESAKGIEFPIVFIVGANEQFLTSKEPENLSKLYVAMTRARDQLYITYSVRQNDREYKPSLLLNKVGDKCEFVNG